MAVFEGSMDRLHITGKITVSNTHKKETKRAFIPGKAFRLKVKPPICSFLLYSMQGMIPKTAGTMTAIRKSTKPETNIAAPIIIGFKYL